MRDLLNRSRLITVLALITVAIGAIGPYMSLLPSSLQVPLMIIGAVAAACGKALVSESGNGSNVFRSLLIVILPVGLLALAACGAGKGLYTVATGLDEGITVKRELAAQNQISPEVELQITRGMLDVDRIFIQITDTALCFEVFTHDVKTGLLNSVDQSLTTLDRLNEQGVLHIKSEKGQRRYERWMSRLRLSAIGIRTALVLIPAKDPVEGQPAPQLTAKQQQELDNLRAWCKRASTLLKQNETRLKEDLVRLGAGEPSEPAVVQ